MQPKDPIEELRETALYQRLITLSPEWAERIRRFVSHLAPVLATTSHHFPYYTRHDAHHGFRVIRRIEQVIVADCLRNSSDVALGATELFLLMAAAYAHDLGMTVFPGESEELTRKLGISMNDGWMSNPILQGYLRKNHSTRGGEYIARHCQELSLPINLVSALDWMMRSHNLSIPQLDSELDQPFASEERVLDVKQLSIILCVADAIEFSDTRVIDGVLQMLANLDSEAAEISYRENMKHICISDSLAIDDGRIIASGTFDDPEVLALAHHTFDQIEQWITAYCDIDRRSKLRRLRVRPEPLQRRLELRNARFERIGVRISKDNIISLVSSNAIWKTNTGASIRELLQNSVEACRYRKHHSPPAVAYEPSVTVIFDAANRSIVVRDNGCGMSERVVLSHFLTVGNSRASEPAYVESNYAPIARFGIGFWSVFTIAQRATVETRSFENSRESEAGIGLQFTVELDQLKDYTVFADKELTVGTSIALYLKPDILVDDVYEMTKKEILCSEVPISLVFGNERMTISQHIPAIEDSEILGMREGKKLELGIETFCWDGSLDQTELSLGIAYRSEGDVVTFLREAGVPLLSSFGLGGTRFPQTAVCGFRVSTRPAALCLDLQRIGIYFGNYRTPRNIVFSIDRQSLIENDASRAFARHMADLIHAGYRTFLKKVGCEDPRSIFRLNRESCEAGGNVYDVCTGDEFADAAAHHPDLLCFALTRVSRERGLAEAVPEFFNVHSILNAKGRIFAVQNSYYIPAGAGRQFPFQAEQLAQFAYVCAQRHMQSEPGPMWIGNADRPTSTLFDADPESTIEFVPTALAGKLTNVCVQSMSIENFSAQPGQKGILATVQGRWTGAVYIRSFSTPDGKPYAFLGRHRVLIERQSRLRTYLEEFKQAGRSSKIAETISLLQEDEQGFTSKVLSGII